MRGEPNQRPNAASSAAPRFWSRNTSTGCSANTRPIRAKVASSSGLERSMPNASVPSSSPSGRSWGELVMGGPPTLSPERCDWGTGTIIGLRAVRGENRKRWVSVRPVRPLAAGAQQPAQVRRIGVLMPFAEDHPVGQVRVAAFLQGLRLLASAYGTRLPDFADTPTIAEQGFPGFHLSAWLGIVVPIGTPKTRVERLSAEFVRIVQTAEIASKYATLGALPRVMSAADFHPFVEAEFVRWGGIVQAARTKLE